MASCRFPWGFEGFGCDDVAFGGVAGLVGEAVLGDLMDRLSRDEEADGDIGEWREFEFGGIADREGSGRNGDGGSAAEGKGAGGGGVDFAVARGEGDVGGAYGERVSAEFVGEDDADCGAAEGDVDDLAEGGVSAAHLQVAGGVGAIDCGGGRGGPGSNPMIGGGS
jgi:hypothetical protein